MTKFEFEVWANHILSLCDFKSQDEIDEFCNLLNTAKKEIDADIVRVLLRTFSDVDDYGIQEQTRNVIESVDKNIFYPVLIDELQALIERSSEKEWALTLLGLEFQYGNPDLLIDSLKSCDDEKQVAFKKFVSSPHFLEEYPEAKEYVKRLS